MGFGFETNALDMVYLYIVMVINIRENGDAIMPTEEGCLLVLMDRPMRVSGEMIFNMEKV